MPGLNSWDQAAWCRCIHAIESDEVAAPDGRLPAVFEASCELQNAVNAWLERAMMFGSESRGSKLVSTIDQ